MKYQLIRSKRKTLSLQINNNAELIVRSPNRLSIKKIEQFINEKSDWIDKNLNLVRTKKPQKYYYTENEKFLYLGNYYPLRLNTNYSQALSFNEECFKLNINTNAETEFLVWYKTAFKKIALPRLEYYAKKHQFNYQQVRFKAQKTIWGSCSGVNNINLNYLLIGAPIAIIDYVIVHELCHIVHKNHSKNFWQLVFSILPNYKTSKRWLKENGYKLHNL
jgi:predicted metal-dependent hydrolase